MAVHSNFGAFGITGSIRPRRQQPSKSGKSAAQTEYLSHSRRAFRLLVRDETLEVPDMMPILPCVAFVIALAWSAENAAQGLPRGSPIKPAPGWQPPDTSADSRPLSVTRQPLLRPASALPEQDNFYDLNNPAYEQLQKANQSLAGMPVDRAGFADWMRMLNERRIAPRASVSGDGEPVVLDLDVLLKNTRQMPWVRFPHRAHTLWLDCSNCHPAPFAQKAGTAKISMESIFRGQWCGMCHDRVAFITHFSCDRCHSVANPAAAQTE